MTSCRYDDTTYAQPAASSPRGFVPESYFSSGGAGVCGPDLKDEAHEIISRVYVGSAKVAKNLEWLVKHNITHILDIGNNNRQIFAHRIKYLSVPLEDDPTAILHVPLIRACHNFIHSALQQKGGNILIHCFAGVSRSPTILASYIMRQNRIGVDQALSLIRSRRPCISINPGFYKQLSEYRQ
jgi:atypical dual specificity phosphatase